MHVTGNTFSNIIRKHRISSALDLTLIPYFILFNFELRYSECEWGNRMRSIEHILFKTD